MAPQARTREQGSVSVWFQLLLLLQLPQLSVEILVVIGPQSMLVDDISPVLRPQKRLGIGYGDWLERC